jgi:hypothetical protein
MLTDIMLTNITDKEAEDDVLIWGSINRAEIVHSRRNEPSWATQWRS